LKFESSGSHAMSPTAATTGSAAPETVPVAFERAVAFPAAFVAVTEARRVEPTSDETAVYDELVAPAIKPQLAPLVSHRSH
jgi:hypothetical protein